MFNLAPAAIVVGRVALSSFAGYVAFQYTSNKVMQKKADQLMKDHDAFMADPFAAFSPEAHRVLYGK